MGFYAINRSGKKYPIYATNACTGTAIGNLYNNECYALIETWAGSHVYYPNQVEHIKFRNSSGNIQEGFIFNKGDGVATPITNFSFGTVTPRAGYSCKSLKTRASVDYYNSNGTRIGTIPSGARILTMGDTTPGSTKPHTMKAYFYETGVGTNVWNPLIAGQYGVAGYVDTGLASAGSDAARISVYGNW